MEFDSMINEIAQSENKEITPVNELKNLEGLNQPNEVTEIKQEATELTSDFKEKIFEFAKERSILHEKIIGKDINGRNVSDWCGCNNACTHSSF